MWDFCRPDVFGVSNSVETHTPFYRPFSRWTGSDNWSYKSCKAPVKSSPPTASFLQAGCPSCRPTNNVKALKGKISHSMELLAPNSPGDLQTLSLTTNSSSSWLPWGGLPCLSSPSDASTPSKHWRDTISYNITWAEIKHSPFVPNIIFGSNNSLGGIGLGLLGSLCVQISPASGGSVSQYSECILTWHFVGHLNIKQPIPISSLIKTIRSSWTT